MDITDRLSLLITANADQAVSVIKGFGSTASTELEKVEGGAATAGAAAGNEFSQNLQKTGLLGIGALQATIATFATVGFAASATNSAVDFNRAVAQLNATLSSTKDAAGTTSEQVNQLADSIQKNDAIFKGTTISGAALLASFQQIQNVAGQGNDIFNRTLDVAASVSNVFGKDMTTAITQVGRALENPQTGMQALSRSGITLDEVTKQQITDFAKQGDLLDAQKTLLSDLETRYTAAGEAIAKADPTQQLSVSFQQFKTQIGEDILPIVTTFITQVSNLFSVFEALPEPVRQFSESLVGLGITALVFTKIIDGITKVRAALAAPTSGPAGAVDSTAINEQTAATENLTAANDAAAASETELSSAIAAQGATSAASVSELSASIASQAAIFNVDAASIENLTVANNTAAASETELSASIASQAAIFNVDTASISATAAAEETLGTSAAAATPEVQALGDTADTTAESITGMDVASGSAGIGIGAVGASVVGAIAGFQIFHYIIGNASHDLSGIGTQLGVTKQQIGDLGSELQSYEGSSFFSRLFDPRGTQEAQDDINKIKTSLDNIANTQGPSAAIAAFSQLQSQFAGNTAQLNAFDASMQPTIDYLYSLVNAENQAASDTSNLADSFGAFAERIQGVKAELDVESAFQSLGDAVQKYQNDKATLNGTSDEAITADKNEADALRSLRDAHQSVTDAQQQLANSYVSLADAQGQVTTATDGLARAEQNLATFEGPIGQEERSLKADELNRRVVTTPAEEDQKQLDILQNQQDNAQKQQELQDAVINGQKSVRDALRQVQDSYTNIGKAENAVQDATQKVSDAEDKLKEAINKRQQLAQTAATNMQKDYLDIQKAGIQAVTAIGNDTSASNGQIKDWTTLLDGVLKQYAPQSDLFKNTDQYYKMIEGHQNTIATNQQKALNNEGAGPNGTRFYVNPLNNSSVPPLGPQTPDNSDFFSRTGTPPVQNFDGGGIVGGPTGRPQFAIVHGGERVLTPQQQNAWGGVTIQQTNHFNGNDSPSSTDLEYANRALGWQLARSGRY